MRISVVAVLPLLCACAGSPSHILPDPHEPLQATILLEMALDPAPPILDVGEHIRLRPVWKCVLRDRQWPVDTGWPIRWSSANPQVATVSNDGVLSARAPGQAVVRGIREARGNHWIQADTVDVVVRVRGADGES